MFDLAPKTKKAKTRISLLPFFISEKPAGTTGHFLQLFLWFLTFRPAITLRPSSSFTMLFLPGAGLVKNFWSSSPTFIMFSFFTSGSINPLIRWFLTSFVQVQEFLDIFQIENKCTSSIGLIVACTRSFFWRISVLKCLANSLIGFNGE